MNEIQHGKSNSWSVLLPWSILQNDFKEMNVCESFCLTILYNQLLSKEQWLDGHPHCDTFGIAGTDQCAWGRANSRMLLIIIMVPNGYQWLLYSTWHSAPLMVPNGYQWLLYSTWHSAPCEIYFILAMPLYHIQEQEQTGLKYQEWFWSVQW